MPEAPVLKDEKATKSKHNEEDVERIKSVLIRINDSDEDLALSMLHDWSKDVTSWDKLSKCGKKKFAEILKKANDNCDNEPFGGSPRYAWGCSQRKSLIYPAIIAEHPLIIRNIMKLRITDDHKYYLGTEALPSVTQVLSDCGIIDSKWFSDAGAFRGSAVHSATAGYDRMRKGEYIKFESLDWPGLLDEQAGYVKGYLAFVKDTGFVPIEIEKMAYHPVFRFAGTYDRIGKIGDRLILPDIKTGAKPKPNWWRLQTGGYKALVANEYPGAIRHSLRLKPNGTYDFSEGYLDDSDVTVFLNLATTWHDWIGFKGKNKSK